VIGISLFTAASAACALGHRLVDAHRRPSGSGSRRGGGHAALAHPAGAAVPEKKRSLAIGIWSAISGLGVAVGPLVGGAVVSGLAWPVDLLG